MSLRFWRFRFAYRTIIAMCISWYVIQVIQTNILTHDVDKQVQHKGITHLSPLKVQERLKRHQSRGKLSIPHLRVVNRNRGDHTREKNTFTVKPVTESNGPAYIGIHRKVHARQQSQEFLDYHVFIQTNTTGIITKRVPPIPIKIISSSKTVTKTVSKVGGKPLADYKDTDLPFEVNGHQWDINNPGEMGMGVKLSSKEAGKADKLFKLHQFDVVVSDMIALNRSLPDGRPQRCKTYKYSKDLPRTSIIIAFHNEAKSAFLRTIHSVINRSPPHLVVEIILVNDASNLGDWHQSTWLQNYISNLSFPTYLLHSPERIGLVGARMLGLSHVSSRSEVVTFLDSHCECTDGWLEPLLERIAKDRTRVVSPVVDAIDDHTFEYISTPSWPHIGGFSWFPEFMWIRVPPEEKKRVYSDLSLPLRTPTISGGLFAVDKNFFHRLGSYDPNLKIWGGENLELSFKVWQCGGSLEIIPCSRVGHIFRASTPYSFMEDPESVFLHNNRRILETWAGNYKHLFYALTPRYADVRYGDIETRRQLKISLGCHDFDWYLKNIYPGHILPRNYKHLGQVRNKETTFCLDNSAVGENKKLGCRVNANICKPGLNQILSLNRYDQLQHDRYCLTPQGEDNYVSLELCALGRTTNARRQEWTYDEKVNHLVHFRTKQCLTMTDPSPTSGDQRFLMAQNCSIIKEQEWILQNLTLSKYLSLS